MRKIIAALAAAGMLTTSAMADNTATQSPLAAGKPAGVKQADLVASPLLFLAGAAAIALVVVLATQGHDSHTTTATSGTSP